MDAPADQFDDAIQNSLRWSFWNQEGVCVVCYNWHTRRMRWWMDFTAPLLRSVLIRNHIRIMDDGGAALADRPSAPTLDQQHFNLCK
jgi:hypothetical protein